MKRTFIKALAIVLVAISVLSFASCNTTPKVEGIWLDATYTQDTTVGSGKSEVLITVEAEETSITITLKTDEKTLGQAMYTAGLINDASFFDTLIGIKADWNKDMAYWAFYEGEKYMEVGVNDVEVVGGQAFRFVYTVYTAG